MLIETGCLMANTKLKPKHFAALDYLWPRINCHQFSLAYKIHKKKMESQSGEHVVWAQVDLTYNTFRINFTRDYLRTVRDVTFVQDVKHEMCHAVTAELVGLRNWVVHNLGKKNGRWLDCLMVAGLEEAAYRIQKIMDQTDGLSDEAVLKVMKKQSRR